jgi:hypothetical protein
MTQRIWTFQLEDGSSHTVQLEHGYFSGKREIYLDNEFILEDKKMIDTGSAHSFQINGHICTVHIRTTGFSFKYDCTIDNRSVETGQEVLPPLPLPGWAWIFIIACGIIPILTLGGAIPAVIGVGGAFFCASVAKDSSKETGTRVAICSGITILCWIIVLVLLGSASILF